MLQSNFRKNRKMQINRYSVTRLDQIRYQKYAEQEIIEKNVEDEVK